MLIKTTYRDTPSKTILPNVFRIEKAHREEFLIDENGKNLFKNGASFNSIDYDEDVEKWVFNKKNNAAMYSKNLDRIIVPFGIYSKIDFRISGYAEVRRIGHGFRTLGYINDRGQVVIQPTSNYKKRNRLYRNLTKN
ncbi:hypothetical protein [Polaribacter ponticola]|uniref:WG repeat-containing protein n=1 Tax=Polaribacter ponticola TaxID=2978475 RepID=A0ABT5SCQ2_9FLAO|nr:hypothetical protein [Polaribacter sp. MSW5]MDD7915908.1 hypothetical protein [Polaribacter sp. MSW5]